jgi:hypothetical protein
MYKLMLGENVIAETAEPITWSERDQAWYVVLPDVPTYFCDPEKQMTVVETA